MTKITQGRLFVQPSVHLGAWPAFAPLTSAARSSAWRPGSPSRSRRCSSRSPTPMAPPSAACSRGATSWRRCSSPGSRAAGSCACRRARRSRRSPSARSSTRSIRPSSSRSLERTSAPLASLLHYAHLALVVGVAALVGRERLTRRRLFALTGIFAGVALVGGAAANPDALGIRWRSARRRAYAVYILLSDRLLRDADPMALTALLTAGASTSFLVAGGLHRDARHGRRPGGPRLPRRRCARRLGLRRQLVPQGRPPRRPVDCLAARHGRGARHDRARRLRAQAAPDARAARGGRARRRRDRRDAAEVASRGEASASPARRLVARVGGEAESLTPSAV